MGWVTENTSETELIFGSLHIVVFRLLSIYNPFFLLDRDQDRKFKGKPHLKVLPLTNKLKLLKKFFSYLKKTKTESLKLIKSLQMSLLTMDLTKIPILHYSIYFNLQLTVLMGQL